MARAASRAREVAVRAAMGATRQRLIRQFLTESLMLAGAGGAIGVGLAFAGMKAIVAATRWTFRGSPTSGSTGARLSLPGLVLTTALVFGLLPAFVMSGVDLQRVLKEGGRGPGGRGGRRAHRLLVAAEIALAVMLLAGAGCSCAASQDRRGRSWFPAGNVMTAGMQLTGGAYRSWPQVEQFHSALVQALQQQPGIKAAGASNFLPLAPGWRIAFLRRGSLRRGRATSRPRSITASLMGTSKRSAYRSFAAGCSIRTTPRNRAASSWSTRRSRRYFPSRSCRADGRLAHDEDRSARRDADEGSRSRDRRRGLRLEEHLAAGRPSPPCITASGSFRSATSTLSRAGTTRRRAAPPFARGAQRRPRASGARGATDASGGGRFGGAAATADVHAGCLRGFGPGAGGPRDLRLLSYAVTERHEELSIRMALGASRVACAGWSSGTAWCWLWPAALPASPVLMRLPARSRAFSTACLLEIRLRSVRSPPSPSPAQRLLASSQPGARQINPLVGLRE